MEQLRNLQDVIRYFSDDRVCRDFLENLRWNGNPVCTHCGQSRPYRLKDGKRFRCRSKACLQNFTVTTGSFLENTKIPLGTWLSALYLATAHKKGISSCQLARDLGITQKTAWFLMHRIRAMVTPQGGINLSGEIVMVDETYVKGKLANKSARKRQLIRAGYVEDKTTVVLGLIDNEGQAVLKVVPNAENESLKPVINEVVPNKNTILVTDGHITYPAIGREYKSHVVVNHSTGQYVNGDFSTNAIESAFSHFKRCIYGTYHFVSAKHCDRYASLFTYRFNSRGIKDAERFVNAASHIEGRLKYKNLISKIQQL